MANTYELIASNTLGSTAASVTFSSIPATYTDLILKMHVRSDRASSLVDAITFNFNSSTTNFSNTRLEGNGSSASSGRNQTNSSLLRTTASSVTANTFSNIEIYLPNYAGSTNKPFSGRFAYEHNSSIAYNGVNAHLWSNTAAITSIELGLGNGPNFVANSSFYLYGIKNS